MVKRPAGAGKPAPTMATENSSAKNSLSLPEDYPARQTVLFAVIGLVVSVLLSVANHQLATATAKPSLTDGILFALLAFVSITCGRVLYVTLRIDFRERREAALWDTREAMETQLSSIRTSLRKLESHETPTEDLFRTYFDGQIQDLRVTADEAARNRRIMVDHNRFDISKALLASFQGGDNDLFRAVHYTKDNEHLRGTHGAHFFNELHDRVKEGACVEVRRLVVAEHEQLDSWTNRLLEFHYKRSNYDVKVIRASVYADLLSKLKLAQASANPGGFGIYGGQYLYLGIEADPDDRHVVGTFVKGDQVKKYIDFFERCWKSVSATQPGFVDVDADKPMTVQELFAPD